MLGLLRRRELLRLALDDAGIVEDLDGRKEGGDLEQARVRGRGVSVL